MSSTIDDGDTPQVDGGGAVSPKAEALRELATLADGAAEGITAVLTAEGKFEMRRLAGQLWRRHRAETERRGGRHAH
jgi:hypothetical protein